MKTYNKLVRDKIPEIIRASGQKPITRILDKAEYLQELIKKLKEELAEFEAEPSTEELADIQEVVIAIREAFSININELEDARNQKAAKNGRFSKRIYLKGVRE